MIDIKQKIKSGIGWLKRKIKKVLVALGIVGVAYASTVALQPKEVPFIEVNEQRIEFPYTDDNEGEDLIIRTNSSTTGGVIYVMVENRSGLGQQINLQLFFKDDKKTITEISELVQDVPYQMIIPEYSTTTYDCSYTASSTNEKVEKTCEKWELVATSTETRYRDEWQPLTIEDFDQHENNLLIASKNIQEKSKMNYKARQKIREPILNKAIQYFRIEIKYPLLMPKPEQFFIEAVGSEGAYGHLDPWLTGYSYRKQINITGQSGAGTDYQVPFSIGSSSGGDFHLEGHCEDFPNDIRFTDNDGETELKYWIKDRTADPIEVWVKITDDLGSNVSIYVYYGKLGDSTTSSIENTFILGDDFESYADTEEMEVNWTPQNPGWGRLETTIVYERDKGMGNYSNSTGNTYMRTFTHTGNRVIENALYFTLAGDKVNYGIKDASNRIAAFIDSGYPTSGKWGYYDSGGWHTSDLTSSPDTWYQIKIIIDMTAKTFSAYANGEIICENRSFNNSDSDANKFYCGYYVSYYDIIRVRKYVSPEPAFSSVGSEETSVARRILDVE